MVGPREPPAVGRKRGKEGRRKRCEGTKGKKLNSKFKENESENGNGRGVVGKARWAAEVEVGGCRSGVWR